ncbi:MAG: TerB family tellurite resistance protein [Pseudomonadota bacterium]
MILIWGTRGRTSTIDSGDFYCPECGKREDYALKEVKLWFTFFFIPIFPIKKIGQYVECKACRATFNERVLQMDPERARAEFEAAFSVAAKRVMFKMALADGEVDQTEIDQITQAFGNLTKREIDPGDIAAELEAARDDSTTVQQYLRSVAPGLNDTGKELVMRSAIAVAKADGHMDDSEVAELHALVPALDLPKAYANGIFAEEGLRPI